VGLPASVGEWAANHTLRYVNSPPPALDRPPLLGPPIRLLGLRFRERDASEVRPEDRLRIDAIYAVTLAFSMVDHILFMSMRARVLVDSLRAGDQLQVARAAAMVACDLGGDGPETKTELVLWEMAHRLADKENSSAGKLAVRSVRGVLACLRGHWTEAKQTLDPLASMVTNRRFALQSAVLFTLYSLYFLGELKELTQRYVRALAEAEDSGNVFMSANLRAIAGVPVWLAADDPEKARHELRAAKWSEGRFSTQWLMAIFGADSRSDGGDTTRRRASCGSELVSRQLSGRRTQAVSGEEGRSPDAGRVGRPRKASRPGACNAACRLGQRCAG
jgi:hypothetical protein